MRSLRDPAIRSLCLGLYLAVFRLPGDAATTPKEPYWIQSHRVTQLLGLKVENEDGQELGIIQNFIVDLRTGQVPYAIISQGGLLGVGARRKLVPSIALSSATALQNIAGLSITSKRWQHAPAFAGLLPLSRPDEAHRICAFYGQPTPVGIEDPGVRTHLADQRPPGTRPFEFATKLIGQSVSGKHGETLGRLSDFLVDVDGPEPPMAIIFRGSILGRKKRFVVALSQFSTTSGRLSLNVGVEAFRAVAKFTAHIWHDRPAAADAVDIYEL